MINKSQSKRRKPNPIANQALLLNWFISDIFDRLRMYLSALAFPSSWLFCVTFMLNLIVDIKTYILL